MGDRRGLEFKPKEKVRMFRRAGGPDLLRCEGCRLKLMGKPFEYDHTVELWELPAEKREDFRKSKEGVPAEYGKLLCIPCHDEKSGRKSGERAHGNRLVKKAAKAHSKTPMKLSRQSPYKRRMDGTVVWRETGEPVK